MSLETKWIQNERDIGVNLNAALHTQEPSRFKFLLACLSPYVNDGLATAQAEDDPEPWQPPFAVGVHRPLVAKENDFEHQPAALYNNSRLAWLLGDSLNPEPLVPVDNTKRIPGYIRTNTPHWVIAREQKRDANPLRESDLVDMLDQLHQKAV